MLKKELEQELNRTKLILDYAKQDIEEKDKEIERLNNIINEVREYITKQVHRNQQFYEMDIDNILEILDKVSDKE